MKIEKIEKCGQMPCGETGQMQEAIMITVEGYPHASPVFPATTKKEDLPALIKAWKVKQDAVDAENTSRLAQPAPAPVVISALKALEGTDIK